MASGLVGELIGCGWCIPESTPCNYALHVLVYVPQAAGVEALGPIQRLHHQLQQSLTLTRLLHTQLDRPGGVHAQAINLEMQVRCAVLEQHAMPI